MSVAWGLGLLVAAPGAALAAWVAFVLGMDALARSAPDRWLHAEVVARVPPHLRTRPFDEELARLGDAGFREVGAVTVWAAWFPVPCRVSWRAADRTWAATMSFALSPLTSLASVLPDGTLVATGVTDAEPEWSGALATSGVAGDLRRRLAQHRRRVAAVSAMRGLSGDAVGDGAIGTYRAVAWWVHRNRAEPDEPRPFPLGLAAGDDPRDARR